MCVCVCVSISWPKVQPLHTEYMCFLWSSTEFSTWLVKITDRKPVSYFEFLECLKRLPQCYFSSMFFDWVTWMTWHKVLLSVQEITIGTFWCFEHRYASRSLKKKKGNLQSSPIWFCIFCYFLFQLLVAKINKYWSVCTSVYGYPFFNSVDRSWLKHVQPHSRYTQHLAVEDGDLCKVHGSF